MNVPLAITAAGKVAFHALEENPCTRGRSRAQIKVGRHGSAETFPLLISQVH